MLSRRHHYSFMFRRRNRRASRLSQTDDLGKWAPWQKKRITRLKKTKKNGGIWWRLRLGHRRSFVNGNGSIDLPASVPRIYPPTVPASDWPPTGHVPNQRWRPRMIGASVRVYTVLVRARTHAYARSACFFARIRHCIHGRGVSSYCILCATSGFFFCFFRFFSTVFFPVFSRFTRAPDFQPTDHATSGPRVLSPSYRHTSSCDSRSFHAHTAVRCTSRDSTHKTTVTKKWYVLHSIARRFSLPTTWRIMISLCLSVKYYVARRRRCVVF